MKRAVASLFLLALLTMATYASAGTLIGTTVNGQVHVVSHQVAGTMNYFDPANGLAGAAFVPSGFQNNAGPTVVIDGTPTFGSEDGTNFDQANFSATTLTISDQILFGGSGPWDDLHRQRLRQRDEGV